MCRTCVTRDNDMMKMAIRCKYCGKPEYYGDFRWLSGKMLCRNCYKAWWEGENKQPYKWDDLDGDRPTEDEVCEYDKS